MSTKPVFKVGQRVKVVIPRDDFDHAYNGRIGVVEWVSELPEYPEYTLKFRDGNSPGIHFMESDLEAYEIDSLTEEHLELKCPDCGEEVWRVMVAGMMENPAKKVKSVIFKCMHSATFDLDESVKNMQEKLDEFKKSGKMEELMSRGFP